jgi:hypothetical protein
MFYQNILTIVHHPFLAALPKLFRQHDSLIVVLVGGHECYVSQHRDYCRINTGKPAGAAEPTIIEVKYFSPLTFYGANYDIIFE